MRKKRDRAQLLEHLATRLELSPEERAVLHEAADLFRSRAAGKGPIQAILWSDGGARGNPGPAGAGAVLKDPRGATLARCSEYLGHTTNNVAEYTALVLGLERAIELGISRIEVRADSELLIRQLQGEYRVKSEKLRPLFARATRMLERFEYAKLTHVPR